MDTPGSTLPHELALERPSPNPARLAATLRFASPRETRVSLALYDAGGRRIRPLASYRQTAGEHAIAWDLRDDEGRTVGAGIYFLRLEAEGRVLTRRFATVR